MGINWTDEQCAALTLGVSEGKFFSALAAELSAQFGVEISRNSAIGKAKRLGLVSLNPPHVKQEKKPRQRKTRSGEHHSIFKIGRIGSGMGPIETREILDRPQLRCVDVTSRRLSLLDLDTNDCRWPDEDSENCITFCGNPKWNYRRGDVDRTSSYCRKHHELSISDGTPSERAATKVSRLVA